MNALQLLNHAAELLQGEALKGPGTVFLIVEHGLLATTRCPNPDYLDGIIARYKTEQITTGLNSGQWKVLMNKIEKALKDQG